MSTINGKACVANRWNLLLDTDFNNLDSWFANQYWTKQPDKYNGLVVMQTTGDWNGISLYVKVKTGEVYTFSLYARYTSGTGTSNMNWLLNANPETGHVMAQVSAANKFVNLSENWQRVSMTTTITADGYIRPRIERTDNNDNTLQIAGMKIEMGTTATPLTPAPVDKVFSDGRQVYGRNYFSVSGFTANKYASAGIDFYDLQLLPNTKYTVSTNNAGIVDQGYANVFVGNKSFTPSTPVNGVIVNKPRTVTTDSTGILTIAARNYSLADGKDKIQVELGAVETDWIPAPEDVM